MYFVVRCVIFCPNQCIHSLNSLSAICDASSIYNMSHRFLFSPNAPLYGMSGHEDKILAVDWTMPQRILSGAADNHLKIFKCSEDLYSKR